MRPMTLFLLAAMTCSLGACASQDSDTTTTPQDAAAMPDSANSGDPAPAGSPPADAMPPATPTGPATPPTPAEPGTAPGGIADEDSCNADAARSHVGQAASADVVEQARTAASAQVARVLKPGQMVTMEFRAGRLNIDVDDKNVITNVRCG